MKILFVPAAIRAALKSAGVSPSDYLNLDLLANTLSAKDVALYIYCNLSMGALVPEDIVASFDLVPFQALLDAEHENQVFFQKVKDKLLELQAHQIALSDCIESGNVVSELFDENTILVYRVANDSSPQNQSDAFTLYERIIQQMYSFIPFEKLASLPVMGGFLSCLQKKAA